MHVDAMEQILDAAEQRFAHYGYGKTTMAEIARDAGMSVGNLYRFFKNKEAIALASTEKLLAAKLEAGLRAAASESTSCGALRAFLLARLRLAHAYFSDSRHLFELVELNNLRHRDILLSYENRVIDAMSEILEQGMNNGDIISGDAHRMAYLMHQALLRYNSPLSLRRNPLDRLETDLHDFIALMYSGLALNTIPQGENT
ncbi:MAG: hypothetical protein BMS9Abin18_1511 [Zetaproteobacteria bacterium]|nr:MAG: hypothetical protein BMS9Abin18_1511 [Zetaproteobacteria bacterium]